MNVLTPMRFLFFFLFAAILAIPQIVSGQSKIILDKQSTGGYCTNYFDLGDFGFALVFNKKPEYTLGVTNQNNVFYYSKDLSKRANFKLNTSGTFSIYASKNYIYAVDRQQSVFHLKVFDFLGREISSRKINLESVGLNPDMIEKMHFTTLGKMIIEVYDGRQDLHIYQIDLVHSKDEQLSEIDIPIPSSDPLSGLKYKGNWRFVGESMGYCILAQKGSDSEYDPSHVAFHIAFYDEDFQLFRVLLLDNILIPNTRLFGKDVSFTLNTNLQRFVVSGLINKNGNNKFMVSAFAMDPNSSILQLHWYKEFDLIDNATHKWIENDGVNVPTAPQIINKGGQIRVSLNKGKANANEEILNHYCVFNTEGKNIFNEVQMGTYEFLNLDNFCFDNNNTYTRMQRLQMAGLLKPYCEMQNCDAIGFDLDDAGNELAVIRNSDPGKNQVIIYRFPKKQ